jgi:dynein heavy chain
MNLTLAHGFRSPKADRFDRNQYLSYIDEKLPPEIPNMFGLHPNAEIGYLTNLGETLFTTILSCSSGGSGGGGSQKRDQVASEILTKYLAALPPQYVMIDLFSRAKDRTPFVVVCL